ncbi:MAG: divalent metal cation transporter, partial [Candidatus Kerfeldbacteria bacterium]|nr:divalent metal cation transporter [Candidatus Kerfeldbacteria bacterium]
AVIKKHTSVKVVVVLSSLLFMVNVINIGADLGAMAAAMQLLIPVSPWVYLAFFALLIALLELFVRYRRYVNVLRWLTLSLFAYVVAAFFVQPDWWSVVRDTIVPTIPLTGQTLTMIVAVLGTTISPYLFFWQTSEEVEEEIATGRRTVRARRGATPAELKSMRRDVATGMVFSNLIMFFIIVTSAATLHQAGVTTIQTAAQAAEALRPLTDNFAFLLFTLGIVGTGLLAIPVLAGSASYALAEVFGWREGLSENYRHAHAFHLVMVAALALGLLSNAVGVSPITFLVFAAVLNGLLAPVFLWYVVRLADRVEVVGKRQSPTMIRVLGWATFLIMAVAAAALIVQYVIQV